MIDIPEDEEDEDVRKAELVTEEEESQDEQSSSPIPKLDLSKGEETEQGELVQGEEAKEIESVANESVKFECGNFILSLSSRIFSVEELIKLAVIFKEQMLSNNNVKTPRDYVG